MTKLCLYTLIVYPTVVVLNTNITDAICYICIYIYNIGQHIQGEKKVYYVCEKCMLELPRAMSMFVHNVDIFNSLFNIDFYQIEIEYNKV